MSTTHHHFICLINNEEYNNTSCITSFLHVCISIIMCMNGIRQNISLILHVGHF